MWYPQMRQQRRKIWGAEKYFRCTFRPTVVVPPLLASSATYRHMHCTFAYLWLASKKAPWCQWYRGFPQCIVMAAMHKGFASFFSWVKLIPQTRYDRLFKCIKPNLRIPVLKSFWTSGEDSACLQTHTHTDTKTHYCNPRRLGLISLFQTYRLYIVRIIHVLYAKNKLQSTQNVPSLQCLHNFFLRRQKKMR